MTQRIVHQHESAHRGHEGQIQDPGPDTRLLQSRRNTGEVSSALKQRQHNERDTAQCEHHIGPLKCSKMRGNAAADHIIKSIENDSSRQKQRACRGNRAEAAANRG